MNSKMLALLTYCFVMAIITVTGNNDTPRYQNKNLPQKLPLQLSTRSAGNTGQLSRSIGSVGQKLLPDHKHSQINEQMNVNAKLRPNVNSPVGTIRNRDTPRYQNKNLPQKLPVQLPLRPTGNAGQLSRSIGSVGQKLLPDYDHSQINDQINVNAKLRPNVNSSVGTIRNRDTPRYQNTNMPQKLQQQLPTRPTGNAVQFSRSINKFGQKLLPDYEDSRINEEMYVNAILRPNVNSDFGPSHNRDTPWYQYENPPRELQQLQPTRPAGNAGQKLPVYDHSQINVQINVNAIYHPNVYGYDGSLLNKDTSRYRNENPPRKLQQPLPTRPNAGNASQISQSIGSVGQKPDYIHSQTNKKLNGNAKLLQNKNSTIGSLHQLSEDTIALKRPNLSNETDAVFVNIYMNKVSASLTSPRTDRPIKLHITNTSFELGYEEKESGAPLKMNISFILSKNVHKGFVLLRNSPKDLHSEKSFEIKRPNLSDETNDKVATVQWSVTREPQLLSIDVQLYNETGVCLTKTISEGIVFQKKLNKSNLDYGNGPICLSGAKCLIEVDLRKECEGAEFTDTVNYKTIIITISATLLAIVLIISVIVAYFKRCWIKVNTPINFERLQIPKTLPFYVNLLFRDECQEIIDDLEKNHYELID